MEMRTFPISNGMIYILDFDEVIFSTTALKNKMREVGIAESDRGLAVFDSILTVDPTFDFASLVFPDALDFLKTQSEGCVVVSSASSVETENNTDTAAQLAFQSEKIARSGIGAYVPTERIYVVAESKTEVLTELQRQHGAAMIFVDDRTRYIAEAQALGITSVLMDRASERDTTLATPRVDSFETFSTLVTTWNETQA